jgi:hypothetical protein
MPKFEVSVMGVYWCYTCVGYQEWTSHPATKAAHGIVNREWMVSNYHFHSLSGRIPHLADLLMGWFLG